MLSFRFHGRGGQGIKTASQILGTAAFMADFQVQDFPLYGAERRGAPIVAFTRIGPDPILERGPVHSPDIVLVGDETLLTDPAAAPLNGAGGHTRVFINSSHGGEALKKHYALTTTPVSLNISDLCLHHLGKAHILSSALAAVAARLSGVIPLEPFNQALDLELSEQGLSDSALSKNRELVQAVFDQVSPLPDVDPSRTASTTSFKAETLVDLKQESVTAAAPIILAPANMEQRKTGNWRTQRPEIDPEHCNGCRVCFVRCPDGAIHIGEDGKPVIDYDHCKGCLICAQECPAHTIKSVREVTAWKEP